MRSKGRQESVQSVQGLYGPVCVDNKKDEFYMKEVLSVPNNETRLSITIFHWRFVSIVETLQKKLMGYFFT